MIERCGRRRSYAGLRLGELRALDWEHVDLASGTITVERSFDPKAEFVEPKSRAGSVGYRSRSSCARP